MNFLRAQFGKRVPAVGEVWKLDTESPFKSYEVEITDFKQGWVRFSYRFDGKTSKMSDESMKLEIFRYCYNPPSKP